MFKASEMSLARTRLVAPIAVCAASFLLASDAVAGVFGTYSGSLNAASGSTIEFKVLPGAKPGTEPRVRFVARDVPVVCGSGEVVLRSFSPSTVRLRSSNLFYLTPVPAPGQDIYGFAGEINGAKKPVKGGLWFDEASEPEGSPTRCSTAGTLKWRAMRD